MTVRIEEIVAVVKLLCKVEAKLASGEIAYGEVDEKLRAELKTKGIVVPGTPVGAATPAAPTEGAGAATPPAATPGTSPTAARPLHRRPLRRPTSPPLVVPPTSRRV